MTLEQQVLNYGRTFKMQYTFDSYGRPSTLTTPSNLAVGYGYDAAGQVGSLTVNGSTFLSSITHQPFGPVNGFTWGAGSGTSYARGYDTDGRLTSYTLVGGTRTLTYDTDSRVYQVTDSSGTQTFGYDADSRINSYSAPGSISQTYGYDANGSRNTQTLNGTTTTFTLDSSNNTYVKYVSGSTTVPFTYDADGSLTAAGLISFSYDTRERQVSTVDTTGTTTYTIDGFGRRVVRAGSGGGWYNQYDRNGDNVGDYSGASSGSAMVPYNETIRIPGNAGEPALPVAVAVNGSSDTPSTLFRIYAGHLSEPRAVTDDNNNQRWAWPMVDAFGNTAANQNPSGLGNFQYNLRWPGQAYDPESTNMYNLNRDMSPGLGRYNESDPIGLGGAAVGSVNTYTYVGSNPANGIDPRGLDIGDNPANPPQYNPRTWATNKWPNGTPYVTDPNTGNTYTLHQEDSGHWRHWDVQDPNGQYLGQCPVNSSKPFPTQKVPPYGNQSAVDPSGNAAQWQPPQSSTIDQIINRVIVPIIQEVPEILRRPIFVFPEQVPGGPNIT